jgi:hypothetical protein
MSIREAILADQAGGLLSCRLLLGPNLTVYPPQRRWSTRASRRQSTSKVASQPFRGAYIPLQQCTDDHVATCRPLIRMPRKVGRLKPSRKSSISAIISPSRIALAAWSTSIIMARWKCATARVQTLERLTSPGSGGSSAQCRAYGRSWVRRECVTRDTGVPGAGHFIGPLPCSVSLTQWRQGARGSLRRGHWRHWRR